MSTKTVEKKFFSLEAERALLHSMLVDPTIIDRLEGLPETDLYDERHQAILRALRGLRKDGKAIDPQLIIDRVDKAGHLDDIEHGAYLSTILDEYHEPRNAQEYARIVEEASRKRQLYTRTQTFFAGLQNADPSHAIDADILLDEFVSDVRKTWRIPQQADQRKTVWTARELLSADFPEPDWVIPDILPVGLTVLAGRPKVGKSWLALQVAHGVATGGMVLDRNVNKRRVLYLALEDSERRLKSRLQKQHAAGHIDVTFALAWPTVGEGGLLKLEEEIRLQEYGLVVIDTTARVLGRADQLDIAMMTAYFGEIQHITHQHNMAILSVDHHRKRGVSEPDPIDDIMGSTAKAAVCDAALGLYRERGRQNVRLQVTGRDVEEHDYTLGWDALTCTWQMLGDTNDVRAESVKGQILAIMDDLETLGELATATSISKALGKDRTQISKELAELLNDGFIVKAEKKGRTQPFEKATTHI